VAPLSRRRRWTLLALSGASFLAGICTPAMLFGISGKFG